ncbi:MAG: flavodoxin domain-containing protein [Dehalococcoidales bacterium]|nr:flavodoxin domain-containing protein [Dehalococcoidales bacterium]
MKTLVIFDSLYGNTEIIARAIAEAITGDVKVLKADDARPLDISDIDLLIIGSPTQGGRHTKSVEALLTEISGTFDKSTKIAVFDTRMPAKWVKIFGFAAGKLADFFKKEGFEPVVPPEPFMVEGAKGPLKEGEQERAAEWGKNIGRMINA